jgi:multidrug resistance efflux pump
MNAGTQYRRGGRAGPHLLLAAGLLGGCHGKPAVERSHTADGAPRVAAQPVDVSTVAAPGVVEPWNGDVRFSSREPGWIVEVRVVEGQTVAAGDLLVRLDDGAQQGAVAEAQAQVREAAAAVARLSRGATPQEAEEARGEAAALEARARLGRAEEARAKRLYEGGALALSDFERTAAEGAAAENAASASAARYQRIAGTARAEDMQAAEARLALARARLAQAGDALARRWVTAPADGTVLWSRFRPGEFYSPGPQPLLVMGDMSRLQVRLEVNEEDASRLAVGSRAVLYSDSGDSLAVGTLFRVAPSIGRRSLRSESPTDREDLRIREAFVEVPVNSALVPGRRVWGYVRPDGRS